MATIWKILGNFIIYQLAYPWWRIGHRVFVRPGLVVARIGKRIRRKWDTAMFEQELEGL